MLIFQYKGDVPMLTKYITSIEIRKIFDNTNRKIEYLRSIYKELGIERPIPRTVVSINNAIIDTWSYEISKKIIREMFFRSDKYLKGLNCKERIDFLIDDWNENALGNIEWPFSAMNFDNHVARLNRMEDLTENEKDEIISTDVIKFRRIKDINTCRNDYIESLIVRYNDNIIPTFRHSRGVDFYIDGIPFDQKVSRSVGGSFIDNYEDDFYNIAINNPELVAISLYENQDEERFDADPRLYVVYLDNDISSESIEQSIIDCDFNAPFDIEFEYKHSGNNYRTYRTFCYIILLHN